jgi:hypothetical protein
MSQGHNLQSIIWKTLMANKFIVAQYIEYKDLNGFYDEMVNDRETANFLRSENAATQLFQDADEALKELEYLTGLGYLEKRDTEVSIIEYEYKLYTSYPVILPMGRFQLSGHVYPIKEKIMSTSNRLEKIYKKLEEFKKNVNSGIYPNMLDFGYKIDKKIYSTVYEVKDAYFDALFFFSDNSETKLYSSIPLNFPNENGFDEKRWGGVKHLEDVNLSDRDKIDKEISNLEWKRDRTGMIILNGKAYWLLNNGRIINYNDLITSEIFGIPNYLEPGFASVENYLSRIFEDSVAQFIQERENVFTKVRHKPTYLNGKEIDVQTYRPQSTESIVCECKFILRNRSITIDELEILESKAKIIKEKNKNENFLFWLATNTQNIEPDAIDYARKNNIQIMIATIESDWHRRSDWSIVNLKELESL